MAGKGKTGGPRSHKPGGPRDRKPGGFKAGPRKPGGARFGSNKKPTPKGDHPRPFERDERPRSFAGGNSERKGSASRDDRPRTFNTRTPDDRPRTFNKGPRDDRPRTFNTRTPDDRPRTFNKGPRDDRPRTFNKGADDRPRTFVKADRPERPRKGGPRVVRNASDGSRAFKGRADFRSDGPRDRGTGMRPGKGPYAPKSSDRVRTPARTPAPGARGALRATATKRPYGEKRPRKGDFPSKSADREVSGARQHSNDRFRPEPSKRVMPPRRAVTGAKSAPDLTTGEPKPGQWLFATRPGAEQDLADELVVRDDNARREKLRAHPQLVTEGLVTVTDFKPIEDRELAFARQGFLVGNVLAPEPSIVALQLLTQIRERARGELRPWALDVWVPDGEAGNVLAQRAQTLEEEIIAAMKRLAPDWAAEMRPNGHKSFLEDGLYAQICLWRNDRLASGVTYAREAISLAPGGRLRMSIPDGAPSRAATKLMEAFVWLRREPEPGDLCVDLGAAPGGWTWVIHQKRAKVLAVDMGKLAPSLRDKKGIYHLEQDAFTFTPDEHVDWLFADLAFRPLDTAGLFCRWARHRWARHLVANIKLPMKQKAHHIERIREMLIDSGWNHLRIRQLYHDREEVTIGATRID